jgi:hypothetical protein
MKKEGALVFIWPKNLRGKRRAAAMGAGPLYRGISKSGAARVKPANSNPGETVQLTKV